MFIEWYKHWIPFRTHVSKVCPQRAAAETKTKGGLLIPEKAQAKGLEAMVMAVGPGRRAEGGATVPIAVAVGDKVNYSRLTVNLAFRLEI